MAQADSALPWTVPGLPPDCATQSITGITGDTSYIGQEPTGLPLTTLQRVGTAMCSPPRGFHVAENVAAMLAARRAALADPDGRIDW